MHCCCICVFFFSSILSFIMIFHISIKAYDLKYQSDRSGFVRYHFPFVFFSFFLLFLIFHLLFCRVVIDVGPVILVLGAYRALLTQCTSSIWKNARKLAQQIEHESLIYTSDTFIRKCWKEKKILVTNFFSMCLIFF